MAPAERISESRKEAVTVVRVSRRFGQNYALKDVSLTLAAGEFVSILGPSGCGKTTLLRAIGGFDTPEIGEILIFGQNMSGVPPYHRPVNTVFQSYALFPHMSVFDNISFGLRMKSVPKEEIKKRVTQAMALTRIEELQRRFPATLSGGQQQRVALARALVNEPKVLLLDEPLGALDLKLRKELQTELRTLQRRLGITFIYVTHDQEEALSMSDRIAVMKSGILQQIGTPREIYESPSNAFVADFVGVCSLFDGIVESQSADVVKVRTSSAELNVSMKGRRDLQVGKSIRLAVRPEKVSVARAEDTDNVISCTKGISKYFGDSSLVELNCGGEQRILARFPADREFAVEDRTLNIRIDPKDFITLNDE